jgi:hypothetical protein
MGILVSEGLTSEYSSLLPYYQGKLDGVIKNYQIILGTPEYYWANKDQNISDFLILWNVVKDSDDMPNIRKFMGRRYNMMVNLPKDFEKFMGRQYRPCL